MVRRGLALLALALVLVGCSPISAGYITKKDHREGYYYPVQYCAIYDTKNGGCKMYATRQEYNPPTWRFDLREQSDGLNGKEPETGWVYVTEDTYARYEVGDYFEEE